MIRVLEPAFNTTLNEWYIRLKFTVLYTFNIQKLGFRTTTQECCAYSNEKIQQRSVYLGNNDGRKEVLENPHNLISYVTLTDCLEIHQRLHSVGNRRSREGTPYIKLVSRRSSSFSTGVDWKQVNTPRFARKFYFRFFFGATSMITRKLNRPRIVSYTY